MASTYENDLRLEEMATGENSGSWGTKTNTNLELIADAFSYGTETIANADTTITIADGAADAARSLALKINSSEDLTTTRVVTLAPNTTSKVWIIENNTSGGQTLTISAGSGSNITLLNGQTKIIATDGIGAGSNVVELTQDIAIADLFIDDDLSLQSDGAIINFGADADITLTHAADTSLTLGGAGSTTGLVVNNTATDGDPILGFALSGTNTFTMGVDDGDSDKFKIGTTAIGTNTRLTIDSTGDVEINQGNFTVTSIGTGAAAGPYLNLFRNSSSPADDDAIGIIQFNGKNDQDESLAYVQIQTNILDATDATEDGYFRVNVRANGSLEDSLTISNNNIIFNDSGLDRDFRVESDSNTHMLFVDAGNNHVNIGGTGTDHGGLLNMNASDGSFIVMNGTSNNKGFINWESNGFTFYTNGPAEAFRIGPSEMVVNEDSRDYDFRVESNGLTHALFVDAGNNNIGLGKSNPSSSYRLDVNGNMRLTGTAGTIRLEADDGSLDTDQLVGRVEMYANDGSTGGTGVAGFIEVKSDDQYGVNTYMSLGTRISGGTGNATERLKITKQGGLIQYATTDGGVTLNETGADADFRVESDSNANMLFVDAGNDRIGIGTSSPSQFVHLQASGNPKVLLETTAAATAEMLYKNSAQQWAHGIDSTNQYFIYDSTNAHSALTFIPLNEVVFNQNSKDVDFRIETDGNANTMFIDSGVNRVRFGKNTSDDSSTNLVTIGGTLDTSWGASLGFENDSSGGQNGFIIATDSSWGIGSGFGMGFGGGSSDNFRLFMNSTETIINERSMDYDFRVESNNESNMLFVDASEDTVSINNTQTTYHLGIGANYVSDEGLFGVQRALGYTRHAFGGSSGGATKTVTISMVDYGLNAVELNVYVTGHKHNSGVNNFAVKMVHIAMEESGNMRINSDQTSALGYRLGNQEGQVGSITGSTTGGGNLTFTFTVGGEYDARILVEAKGPAVNYISSVTHA